jgi:hypothetical protein
LVLYNVLLFFVQYLIPTVWWHIYSVLPQRLLISLDVHDYLILNFKKYQLWFFCLKSNCLWQTDSTFLGGGQLTLGIHWPCYCAVCVVVNFFIACGLFEWFFIPSPTKLRRDIVMLPSVRHILVNTLGSTSFNGFWPNLVHI